VKTPTVRVVKVGGSLLDLPDLPARLRDWLARQQPAHQVLIAGGGSLVEQVRHWHAAQPLDEVVAHWMCVDLLAVTARLLQARLPEIPLVEDDRLLRERAAKTGCTIFDPAAWLRRSEPGLLGTRLPSNWEVTSDAIAGRLAVTLDAEELVLMKSVLPQSAVSSEISHLSATGYIDPMLARLASELPSTRLVNLRSDPPQELEKIGPC